jgi:hypothetical protein
LLEEVNDRTFRLPDLRGIYAAPGNLWHYQMQANVCFWALCQYLRGAKGPFAVTTGDYYAADRLQQVPSIRDRIVARISVFEKRGEMKHPDCRGAVQPLAELASTIASGTIVVWNEAEYEAVCRHLLCARDKISFDVVNYEHVARRTRLWLGREASKMPG